MKRILKNRKVRGLFLISILVWSCPSDFWQHPAFGETVKEPEKLSPQGTGSAWDLPAGVYGEDEQENEQGDDIGPGGSPTPGRGGDSGPVGPGESPSLGQGGNTDPVGPGGSPAPGRGGNSGPGGSPRPSNQ